MASKRAKIDETTEAGKHKALLSTIAHMIGLKEGKDGKLEVTVGESSGRGRSEVLNVENLSTEYAQQWRPGALLQAVGDLGVLSSSEVGKVREKLSIRQVPPPSGPLGRPLPNIKVSRPPIPPPDAVGASFGRPKPGSYFRGNYQPPPNVELPPPVSKSGFYPPRKVQAVNQPTDPAASFQNYGASHGTKTLTSSGTNSTLYSVPTIKQQSKPGGIFGSTEQQPQPPREMAPSLSFRTATEQLILEDKKKGITRNYNHLGSSATVSGLRKPARSDSNQGRAAARATSSNEDDKPISDNPEVEEIMSHECMKNIDPKMVEAVLNEVVQIAETSWDDIAGLEAVKTTIQEIIILPMLRPDLFTGIRSPAKGILFFGPPGTGKTMFGRLIATQSKSTFFNISASSLTSKWIGDGEKMVRALFGVARVKQPAVIFIDEIDSILTQRSDTEHESSRRLKTEFLIQFDGAATSSEDRILVIGVTNRPQELDEAARRRLVKRIYIPLPDYIGRKQIVKNLTHELTSGLVEKDYDTIAEMTEGYSGADMNSLCKEAAIGPLRDVPRDALQDIHASQVRSIQMKDFVNAQRVVKSSVAESDVKLYENWNAKFGCHS